MRSGAHVLLDGLLGDEVVLDGEILDEDYALAEVIRTRAGIELVLLADRHDGMRCADPADEQRVSEIPALAGALGAEDPVSIANATRTLLGQADASVAVVLRDPGLLLDLGTEQGRMAVGVLREAMVEARALDPGDPMSVRNALVLKGVPHSPALGELARVPGVVRVSAMPLDRPARRVVLEQLRGAGFYGDPEEEALEGGLDHLARATHGETIRGLAQLRRRSHIMQVPASRPETLLRAARGERGRTPIERVGVDVIMEMLAAEIKGQPAALASIRSILSRGRRKSANRPPGALDHRPLAAMLFHGAPGVGKTESSQIIAEALCGTRQALVRIDCSEYVNQHDKSRLTGSAPGYVGYEDGGALHDALNAEAAVIVFDEFDRAQGGLDELLLQVFDAGRLTDGRGRTASFENAIVILTTNKSHEMISERCGAVLLDSETYLQTSAELIDEALLKEHHQGGIGSAAFHSRMGGSAAAFDHLREPAVREILEQSCRNMSLNLADEIGAAVHFDVPSLEEVVLSELGAEGTWDGRRVRVSVIERIEAPAREAIEALGEDSRSEFRVTAGPGGAVEVS